MVLRSATAIRCVLLDAVGTLIHPRPCVAEVYWNVGSRHGSRLTIPEIRAQFARSIVRHHDGGPTNELHERERWRAIVSEVLHDIPHAGDSPFEELWNAFAQPNHWSLFPDVAPAWKKLQSRGLTIGIASNFDSRLWPICCALPPLQSANHCFVSSQIGFPKPHPSFYRHVERQLDVSPAEILLVGDSLENDVGGALAAGWHAVHLDRSLRTTSEQAERTMGSLADLAERLEVRG